MCMWVCVFSALSLLLPFFYAPRKPPHVHSVPVAIVSTSLMDSSHPVSLFSLFLPLCFSHIISMFSHGGWLKGFLAGVREKGEERGEEMGEVAEQKSGPYYPICLDRVCGVEVLFQLINRDTVSLISPFLSPPFLPCLLFLPPPDSPIRDNVSGIDTVGSGYYDRNTVLLNEAEFHVKTLWSTKQPESSTSCLSRFTLC